MATSAINQGFIEAVAAEMSAGIRRALDGWMGRVESALGDPKLTSLGRLRAVQQIVSDYKNAERR
jgi:hypothetical protein